LKRSRLRRTDLLVVAALLHWSDLPTVGPPVGSLRSRAPWYPIGSLRQGIAALQAVAPRCARPPGPGL